MPRGVSAMVAADQHVWIAVQATSIIKCYNTTTYECTSEINVGPDVIKILAGKSYPPESMLKTVIRDI